MVLFVFSGTGVCVGYGSSGDGGYDDVVIAVHVSDDPGIIGIRVVYDVLDLGGGEFTGVCDCCGVAGHDFFGGDLLNELGVGGGIDGGRADGCDGRGILA